MKLILARLPAGTAPHLVRIEAGRIVLPPDGVIRELAVEPLADGKAVVYRRAGGPIGFDMEGEGHLGFVRGQIEAEGKTRPLHGLVIEIASLALEPDGRGQSRLIATAAAVGSDLPEGVRIEWRHTRSGPGGIVAHLADDPVGFLTHQRFPEDDDKDALADLAALQVMTGLRTSVAQKGRQKPRRKGGRVTPEMVKASRDAWQADPRHKGSLRGWVKFACLDFGIDAKTLDSYLRAAECGNNRGSS